MRSKGQSNTADTPGIQQQPSVCGVSQRCENGRKKNSEEPTQESVGDRPEAAAGDKSTLPCVPKQNDPLPIWPPRERMNLPIQTTHHNNLHPNTQMMLAICSVSCSRFRESVETNLGDM